MRKVAVYTKSQCVQCDATKRKLTKAGVDFELVNLEENPDLISEFSAAGFVKAPIVVTEEYTWSGFQPDLIKKYIIDASHMVHA